jgi:hypothetical protein
MAEKESKIVNVSTTDNVAALAYRAAVVTYTKRNYRTKKEAERQNIDFTPVSKAVQRQSSIEMAQGIKAQMEDKEDISDFIKKMFKGPLGLAAYEVEVVEEGHDKVDLEYHYCPLVQAWQGMGLSDEEIAGLCDSAMVGDLITAEEMGYDLDIQKTIARGDGVCKLVYTKKKQG